MEPAQRQMAPRGARASGWLRPGHLVRARLYEDDDQDNAAAPAVALTHRSGRRDSQSLEAGKLENMPHQAGRSPP